MLKCLRNETYVPSESLSSLTEEHEIYKIITVTDKRFTQLLRVGRNSSLYRKTTVFLQETFVERNSTYHSCG